MAARRIEYISILAAALLFYAFCTDYISFYLLLFVVFLPVLSILMTCLSGLSLTAVIENPETTIAGIGDELRVYVRLTNPSRLGGARVRMNLLIDYQLEGKTHTERMRFVTEKKEQTAACLVSAEHCGHITCRIEKLRLYDYLWLFAIPGRAAKDHCSFTVMPKLYDIDPLCELVPREDFESDVYAQERPGRDYTEVYEVRAYREGDPLSSVHHKLSAKKGEPVVREGSFPVGNSLMLLPILPDWGRTIEECEAVLGAVFSVSSWLLANDTPHRIAWLTTDVPEGVSEVAVEDEASFYEAASFVMESGRDAFPVGMDISLTRVQRLLCFAARYEDAENILFMAAPEKMQMTVYFASENGESIPELPGVLFVYAWDREPSEALSSLVI